MSVYGVEFSDNDMYTTLMKNESDVLEKLTRASTHIQKHKAHNETFFSMSLQTLAVEFTTNIVSILKKVFTTKDGLSNLSNTEIFYCGIFVVIIAGMILLCEM